MRALAISLLIFILPPLAYAQTNLVDFSFAKIYVPSGYDTNDSVQIIGEGALSSSCARIDSIRIQISNSMREILVGPIGHEEPGPCNAGSFPFHQTINFGNLLPGNWKITNRRTHAALGAIEVSKANPPSSNDALYAPVRQAFFKNDRQSTQVLLVGDYDNDCMKIVDIRITTKDDVISMSPIVKYDSRRDCKEGKFPFQSWTAIDFLKPQKFLVHIRTMNGNSINELIDVN